MSTAEQFGQWLKQRRRLLDLTQQDLAQAVGCSVASIRKYEAGERRPSRQIAEQLTLQLHGSTTRGAGSAGPSRL